MFKKHYSFKLLICWLLCQFLMLSNSFAQEVTATIPYEVYGGKMIIKMLLNGQEERFIFDTGAGQSSISAAYARQHNLPIVDSVRINDVTSKAATYKLTELESITTTDRKIGFNGLRPAIMPDLSVFIDCFHVVGLLGSDMLSGTICTIDARTKTITLTDGKVAPSESLRYSHNFSKAGHLPIFNVIVNGQELQILMDSGAGEFMVLKQADFEKLKSSGTAQVLKKGRGGKAMGLAGEVDNLESTQVCIPGMRVGPAKFANIICETSNPPFTLLGLKFMEHARVTIDYPRKRVFYIPYEQAPLTPAFTDTNFGITVKDNRLKVAHIWSDLAGTIDEGDLITHIDGVETGTYEFCDVIAGIPALKGTAPKLLTIKTKQGKTVKIEYKVKKIEI